MVVGVVAIVVVDDVVVDDVLALVLVVVAVLVVDTLEAAVVVDVEVEVHVSHIILHLSRMYAAVVSSRALVHCLGVKMVPQTTSSASP